MEFSLILFVAAVAVRWCAFYGVETVERCLNAREMDLIEFALVIAMRLRGDSQRRDPLGIVRYYGAY